MNNFDKLFNETLLRDVKENNLTAITQDYVDATTNKLYLEHVVIPEGITAIDRDTFSYTDIVDVALPNSLIRIGDFAFAECSKLQKIDLPTNLASIGSDAFVRTGLKSLTIPDSVEYIGDDAFGMCKYLTHVTIGKNAKFDGESPFYICPQISEFNVHPENLHYSVVNGCLMSKDGTTLFGCKTGSVVIPDGTKKIAYGAGVGQDFDRTSDTTGLTDVEVPATIEDISEETFNYCQFLKTVTFKSGLTSIGRFYDVGSRRLADEMFGMCPKLDTINFPDSLTEIGDNMFFKCTNLKSVKIPDSVKRIGKYSFLDCNPELYDVTTIPGIVMVDGWVVNFTRFCPEHLDLSNVRGIADGALDYCMVIRSIKLPPHADPEKFSVKKIHNPRAKDE